MTVRRGGDKMNKMNKMDKIHRITVAAALLLAAALPCRTMAQKRLRDWGISTGVMKTGPLNAITDVKGVLVGHVTLDDGKTIHTGVTAIVPHEGNVFRKKCPAGVYVGNGFGKLAGFTQVKELGTLETPVVLTNTLNVAEGIRGLVTYTLGTEGNEGVRSVNAVVGETNDGGVNDIAARSVTEGHVLQAIASAHGGPVEEGNVGAGTGTVAFGYKGGIGTASRVLPSSMGGYTVGVLVQTNYGGVLNIAGVEIGQLAGQYTFRDNILQDVDGSCMIVVATDAPVDARNLERMAKRAMLGLARTGGIASNGSGDYVIAFSNCESNLVDESTGEYSPVLLHNDAMSGLFLATIEATAEAVWNSLFAAEPVTLPDGRTVRTIDKEWVVRKIKAARKAVGLKDR